MITIRHAIQNDSDKLIRLTGLTPMKGQISLRIDRHPDFFHLLKERGDAIVLIAENQLSEIIGCFTACKRKFFLNHQEESIYYLGDLKIHPNYSGTTLAYRLIKQMHQELIAINAKYMFCVTALGNNPVLPFFKAKANIPPFENFCQFNIYQILPSKRKNNAVIKTDDYSDDELDSFYNSSFKKYFFSPKPILTNKLQHLVKKNDDRIIAAISLFDTSASKQNVVIDYPFWIAFVLGFLKIIQPFFSLYPVPEKNQKLNILHVKYYAMADGYEKEFGLLLKEASHLAFEKNYHFLSIGTDVNNFRIIHIIKKFKSFVFKSNGWICDLKNKQVRYFTSHTDLTFEDFSIV